MTSLLLQEMYIMQTHGKCVNYSLNHLNIDLIITCIFHSGLSVVIFVS